MRGSSRLVAPLLGFFLLPSAPLCPAQSYYHSALAALGLVVASVDSGRLMGTPPMKLWRSGIYALKLCDALGLSLLL